MSSDLPASARARQLLRAAGFVGVTGAMLPLYMTRDRLARSERRDEIRDRWVRRWSRLLLDLFGIRVTVLGDPSPPRGRGRLVVANHRSAIDVGVLLHTFGGRMVSRSDLSGWPLVGAAARSVGTVFVDRADAGSGASAIRSIRELLKAHQTVIIFPEGTTFPGDEVRPFQPGSFLAALRTESEVLPVGIAYERGSEATFFNETFTNHLGRMAAAPKPTRVTLSIGSPILVERGTRSAPLAAEAHAAVQELVHRSRASVDSPASP